MLKLNYHYLFLLPALFCINSTNVLYAALESGAKPSLVNVYSNCNIDDVKKILETENVEINEQDAQGMTVLHWAVCFNDKEMFERFVEEGADLTIKNKDFNTALESADSMERREFRELVIERARIKSIDEQLGNYYKAYEIDNYYKNGKGKFLLFCQNNKIGDANLANVFKGKTEDCKFIDDELVKNFPLPMIKSCQFKNKKETIFKILQNIYEEKKPLEGLIPKPIYKNVTQLHKAAFNGDIDQVKLLVEKGGLDVNEATTNGNTPLIFACKSERGTEKIVAYLLEKGADIMKKNIYGENAMFWAKRNKKSEVIEMLKRYVIELAKKELGLDLFIQLWTLTKTSLINHKDNCDQNTDIKYCDKCSLEMEKNMLFLKQLYFFKKLAEAANAKK